MARLYRYVVKYDGGSAPNPYGGVCTLAICKPSIRRTAKTGDWIIGLRGGNTDHVTYVMKVDEILSLGDYWADARFESKKPGLSSVSDNIYRKRADGTLEQLHNLVHDAGNALRDESGLNVLAGRTFWYFGRKFPRLPDSLMHLRHFSQGHSVNVRRRASDFVVLEDWLRRWEEGVHGMPAEAPAGFVEPCQFAPTPAEPPRSSCGARSPLIAPVERKSGCSVARSRCG